MKKINLLIVEDEEAIRDMLRFSLSKADFSIIDAESAEQAIHILKNKTPDVIIVDWMLPKQSGLDFLMWVRNEEFLNQIPIIMLTAKAEEESKIKGLMLGADDYITKPFSTNELVARIKVLLRRGLLVSPENCIKIDDMVLDVEKKMLSIKDKPVKLLPLEYKLLYFFMKHPNKTYSRDQLISHVYGRNVYIEDRTIDVQVKRLRAKLHPFGYDKLIKTIRGFGYCFMRDADEEKN